MMNIKRQCAMVKSVAKNIKSQERKNASKEKKTDKFYSIMRKYNSTLDEITKDQLTKTEYKFVIDYITNELKYPLEWYPNLI